MDLQFCKSAHIICHDFDVEGYFVKELSSIAQAVQASTTMAIDAMFKQMKADGIDVIGFGAGEPDFNTRTISRRPVWTPLRITLPATLPPPALWSCVRPSASG